MHLIHGYKHLLEEFEEPVMLTLTMKNCKGRELKAYYKKMIEAFKRATRNARKTHGINCKGIRNWECTYNAKEDEFHPHFHVFLNSKKEAELIRDYWMKDWEKRVGKKHIRSFSGSGWGKLWKSYPYGKRPEFRKIEEWDPY